MMICTGSGNVKEDEMIVVVAIMIVIVTSIIKLAVRTVEGQPQWMTCYWAQGFEFSESGRA